MIPDMDDFKAGFGVGMSESFKGGTPQMLVYGRGQYWCGDNLFINLDLGYRENFDYQPSSYFIIKPGLGVNFSRLYLMLSYDLGLRTHSFMSHSQGAVFTVGYRFGDIDYGAVPIWTGSSAYNFFKHTVLNVETGTGLGLGTTRAADGVKRANYEWYAGLNWLYDFNDNFALGLGGRYYHIDTFNGGDTAYKNDTGALYVRAELKTTSDLFNTDGMRGFVNVDLGEDSGRLPYIGAQMGLLFHDHWKVALQYYHLAGNFNKNVVADNLGLTVGVDI